MATADGALAHERHDADPQRRRADPEDGADAAEQQQPVGDGIEHLAHGGHLVEVPGQVPVDPVGRAHRAEDPRRRVPLVVTEQQPQEQREQAQPGDRDDIGQGEDAVLHTSESTAGAPGRGRP